MCIRDSNGDEKNMIEIKELSISNRQKKILVGLNLNIDKGERVSILGKSGDCLLYTSRCV